MTDLETATNAISIFSCGIATAIYLGTRSTLLWEKKNNIVNGQYKELLECKRSNFYHKLFFLGKPSKFIADYS